MMVNDLTYFDDQNVHVFLIDYLKTLFRTSELGFLAQKGDIEFFIRPQHLTYHSSLLVKDIWKQGRAGGLIISGQSTDFSENSLKF